uniref:Homeobox domain-containing protein n=2 Tax=Equus caballus TaxID=9796 RepID=A0A9L0TMT0_HORSE
MSFLHSSLFGDLPHLRMDVPYFGNSYVRGISQPLGIQGATMPSAVWPPVTVPSTCYNGNCFHQRTQEDNSMPTERLLNRQAAMAAALPDKPKRRSRERTSFTPDQKAELEALFSLTQFPDYVTQESLASKIHLQYSVVQVWFKNRRVKWRKSEWKVREGLPARACPAKRKTATAPRDLADGGALLPRVPDPQSTPLTGCSEDCFPNPDGTSPQCDSELDGLVATVPALSSTPYDIAQVMEAYGCFEEAESSSTFTCLYQYLSLSDS